MLEDKPTNIWILDYSTGNVYDIIVQIDDSQMITNDDYEEYISAIMPDLRLKDCNWMITHNTVQHLTRYGFTKNG